MDRTAPNTVDYVLLVTLSAIFGGSFMLTKVAVAEIPAATLVAIRLALASMIFVAVMYVMGQKFPRFGKIWIPILAAALTGNAMPFFLISWGQEKVDAGLAAILMSTMPLMTILLAHFLTQDEKLTRFKVAGFCLGLIGVAFMIGFDRLGTLGEDTVRQYAIAGGALCYAINAIITKSLVHLPRYALMAVLMIVSTLMILPISLIGDNAVALFSNSLPSGKAMMAAIGLGIFPTAVGTLMVFVIVSRQGATFISQINFMVPVFGVLWGMIFLSEILPGNAIIALVLILAGVAISRIKTKSAVKSAHIPHKETRL